MYGPSPQDCGAPWSCVTAGAAGRAVMHRPPGVTSPTVKRPSAMMDGSRRRTPSCCADATTGGSTTVPGGSRSLATRSPSTARRCPSSTHSTVPHPMARTGSGRVPPRLSGRIESGQVPPRLTGRIGSGRVPPHPTGRIGSGRVPPHPNLTSANLTRANPAHRGCWIHLTSCRSSIPDAGLRGPERAAGFGVPGVLAVWRRQRCTAWLLRSAARWGPAGRWGSGARCGTDRRLSFRCARDVAGGRGQPRQASEVRGHGCAGRWPRGDGAPQHHSPAAPQPRSHAAEQHQSRAAPQARGHAAARHHGSTAPRRRASVEIHVRGRAGRRSDSRTVAGRWEARCRAPMC